jgi:hypothetical protein
MIKAPSAMASPSSTTRGEVTFYTLVFWRAIGSGSQTT